MEAQKRQKTVAEKMGVKPMTQALLINAPGQSVAAMRLPTLKMLKSLNEEDTFDYLHLFATTQDQMHEWFPVMRDRLHSGGMLWVSWPKGGRLGTDLTMKSVISIGYTHTMVESICLRIDEVWAGLKFTHPKPGKKYANSYGTLPNQKSPQRP